MNDLEKIILDLQEYYKVIKVKHWYKPNYELHRYLLQYLIVHYNLNLLNPDCPLGDKQGDILYKAIDNIVFTNKCD